MKINYYQDTDSLYISLSEKESVETREIVDGLNIDFDSHGQITGIDIERAKKFVELDTLVAENLPLVGGNAR